MSPPTLDIMWRTDGQTVPPGHIAIVVDVLRACTNLTTAFSMGAKNCLPTTDIDEARRLAAENDALLIGERNNARIQGFDYGNSPLELEPDKLSGATIVFTSTNFPHALNAAAKASTTLIGALVNLSVVSRRALALANQGRTDITIMLAGEPSEKHAAEDLYFAARAAHILAEDCTLTNAAKDAIRQMAHMTTAQAIQKSIHAAELIDDGFEKDVNFAFTIDKFTNLARLQGECIIPDS